MIGLSVNYADGLQGDGTINGFDTGAEGLQDVAESVAVALQVTRRAVDAIYFLKAPAAESIRVDFREVSASPQKPEELIYEVQIEDVAVEAKGLKIALSLLLHSRRDQSLPLVSDRYGAGLHGLVARWIVLHQCHD